MRIREEDPYSAGGGGQATSITPTVHERQATAAPCAAPKAEPLLRAKNSGVHK
ncbi:MAG TPA: hypothetical protein VFY40_25620 [Blastocatellia bacterium]|nr:hypothetical protein [Blastocatellia bacterium]